MTEKIKNYIVVCTMGLFLLTFFVWNIVKPAAASSDSERRNLAQFPKYSTDNVLKGKFMSDFESFSMDQFPLRDSFRTLKALAVTKVFRNSDMNGLYVCDGVIAKQEYPLSGSSVENAAGKFNNIYNSYIKDLDNTRVFYTVVPDKGYFLAEDSGHLHMDVDKLVDILDNRLEDSFNFIDIFDLLDIEDYYATDTHWRQERITDVAERIIGTMRGDASLAGTASYSVETLDHPFYGVYHGQAALPIPGETLYYLTNENLQKCTVLDYETNKEGAVYNMELAAGRDPYEMYLSGSRSLLKISNPAAKTDRKLIIFRDSFGSSIAPLLLADYSEVMVIDIRYLMSASVGKFVDFENSDVLFLYSSLVLNNSITLK